MQLAKIKNRITSSFQGLYKQSHLDFCNQLEIPVFGISNGAVVYTNSCFDQNFKIASLDLESLIKKPKVNYNDINYAKQRMFSDEKLQIFQLIKENTPNVTQSIMPHILLDKDCNVIKANPAFYKLLEIVDKKFKKNILEYIDEKSRQSLIKYLSEEEKNKKAQSLEIKFNNKANTTALMYFVHVSDENIYHSYLVDITEYKNVEMHFIHSQKMQAIGQLSGGIAHDFNNLLTAILGFCDLLLLKHPAGDPSFAEIMQIKQNSNRAANLVRQLLALSRKQVLKPKVLDVTDTIAELANLIRRLIGESVKLNINYARDLGAVKVDQSQLEQVIINLVVNAKDAILAQKEVGTITIATKNVLIRNADKLHKELTAASLHDKISPGRYVLIEVVDTGIGIPKSIKDKIFDPFFSTKEIGAGTGLGLSTVYGILNQIGGHIYVESKEGEGSRFCVYLKEFINVEEREVETMEPIENKLIQKDMTGDAKILLVEDEAPVRMFAAHALANKGYKIIEAGNGEEAMEIMNLQGKDIDIIITDVIMPDINGPSLISEIQKKHPKVKVIFISGYAEEAFSDAYGVESDNDFNFLSKPFTLQQLVSKVKEVLDMKIEA